MNGNFYIYPPDPPSKGTGQLEQGDDHMIDQFMETAANVFAALAQGSQEIPAAALVWLEHDPDTKEISAHCQAVSYHAQALGLLGFLGGNLLTKQTIQRFQQAGLMDDEEDDDDTD